MHDRNESDSPELTSEILSGHFHKAAISVLPFALTISNPRIDDNPLVYVSPAFCRITGYAKESCVGRNCRFLQGADTDPDAVAAIREGIENEREVNVDLLNYRADGTEFWNRLLLAPLFDDDGELAYFMGIQHELRDAPKQQNAKHQETVLEELQHRVKNHLAMVVSMIRMQARSEQAGSDYKTLARRVETLQLLYQELSDAGVARHNSDTVPLGAYISRVASAVSHLDGARRIDPEHPSAREIRALDRGARVVVYCSVGFRSAIIESWLHEQGFDDVYNLAGGLFEWANEGRPMIDGEGQSTDLVHPYDATWGRFLEESHRLPR